MRRLTSRHLREAGACAEQRERFRSKYPRGVEVTPLACLEAAGEWDWDWAGTTLLLRSGDGSAFGAARASAQHTYDLLFKLAMAHRELRLEKLDGDHTGAASYTDCAYCQQSAPIVDQCDDAMDAAAAIFKQQLAIAFGLAWNLEPLGDQS